MRNSENEQIHKTDEMKIFWGQFILRSRAGVLTILVGYFDLIGYSHA